MKILKLFARVKPGSTIDTMDEETASSQKQNDADDDEINDEDGWEVSGTIKNNQKYIKPSYIHQIVQV